LQDEQLVVRELSRSPRLSPAYATAAVAAGSGWPAADDAEDEDKEEEDEELDASNGEEVQPDGAVAVAPPAGSRLADVAKAAAIKAERATIEETLHQVRWNRRRAAEQLGVSNKTLLNKIKECGISRK
jgi:DNA-binding NtrC family response regulator